MNDVKQVSIVPHILFGMFILELFFLMVKKVNLALYGPFDLFGCFLDISKTYF